jgi:hypothetical protein
VISEVELGYATGRFLRRFGDALSVVADSAVAAVVLIVAMLILVPIAGALLAADGVAWIWRGVRGCLSK